jgi:hypothetical protein
MTTCFIPSNLLQLWARLGEVALENSVGAIFGGSAAQGRKGQTIVSSIIGRRVCSFIPLPKIPLPFSPPSPSSLSGSLWQSATCKFLRSKSARIRGKYS